MTRGASRGPIAIGRRVQLVMHRRRKEASRPAIGGLVGRDSGPLEHPSRVTGRPAS